MEATQSDRKNGKPICDSWQRYIREIEHIPILTKAAEIKLAEEYRSGVLRARDELVVHNLRYVVSLASRYSKNGIPMEDLVSEGNLGLLEAVKHYDPGRGIRFLTYARWWIRRSILYYLTNRSRMVRIPEDKVNKMLKINRYRRKCELVGEVPNDATVAKKLHLKNRDIENAKKLNYVTLSLDASKSWDGQNKTSVFMEKEMSIQIEAELEAAVRNNQLERAMEGLNAREAEILLRHYGFMGHRESLQKIAEEKGISRERVRQIKQRALGKMRASAAGPGLQEFLAC